jgi:dTDP-4-amino-4,6-dideoxygalactose transaminase
MKHITDFSNPFQAIEEFERLIGEYTGAPYCITTDCCTHGIEIAFRLAHDGAPVTFPARTYLSVLMTMHKLGIPYILEDVYWREGYQFKGSNIWDCARLFKKDMYVKGSIQCLSFGRTKPLQIFQGGCILTDDKDLYQKASRMRYDGRDIFQYSVGTQASWAVQKKFDVGYHYYLRPEDCITGLNLLEQEIFLPQLDQYYNYPDCREIQIKT